MRAFRPVYSAEMTRPLTPQEIISRVEYDTNGGCWLWTGTLTSNEYGSVKIRGKRTGAHRYFYEAFNGPIPDSLLVCHKCDVRCCVNPAHLFCGDASDNMTDMSNKGRAVMPNGIRHRLAKLSPEKAELIRRSPLNLVEAGVEFGVHHTTILRVRQGKNWKTTGATKV